MRAQDRTILHVDLDAFYASAEILYNPSLRGKPVAVVGDQELRHGIVLAKSYEAKRYDVKTGDAIWQAKQKCKELEIVPANFERYLHLSKLSKELFSDYSDRCESFGLDESWIDLSGCTHLFGTSEQVAKEIRARIKSELGLTASVGISFNKVFAKLGSDQNKPDGQMSIPFDTFKEQVWPLAVSELLYVGRATTAKLHGYGIRTIGGLANTQVDFLESRFGKIGRMLWLFANGLDTSPVSNIGAKSLIKSVGNSTTTPRDLTTDEEIKITLYALCESVAERLREYGFRCKTVSISIRDNTLQSFERQITLERPSCTAKDIFSAAFALFKKNINGNAVRSIGIKACNLVLMDIVQLSLFPDAKAAYKQEFLEETIDSLRGRFGHYSIQRGIMLTDEKLAINPKHDHIIHPIGFLS